MIIIMLQNFMIKEYTYYNNNAYIFKATKSYFRPHKIYANVIRTDKKYLIKQKFLFKRFFCSILIKNNNLLLNYFILLCS